MKKIVLYSIGLMMLTLVLPAQLGPGYMGKRCAVGYGLNFSPAVFGPNGQEACLFQTGSAPGGDIAFNSMHEGFLEFAFKNRTSIGFSAKYYRTNYANQASLDNQSNSAYYDLRGNPQGMYSIKGLDYNLYFKFYGHRYVAPWGRYIIIGAVLNRYKCTYDPSRMYVPWSHYDNTTYTYTETKFKDFGPSEQEYMRGDIRFGWGRSRILLNRLTLDYGVNFELFALAGNVFTTVLFEDEDGFSSGITTTDYIERTSRRRVRQVSSVNIFLKIGVLIF
jgi:hypothetical protein